jgi:hypothetical protein
MSVIHAETRRRLYALVDYLDVQIRTADKRGNTGAGLRRFRSDLEGVLKTHGGRDDRR